MDLSLALPNSLVLVPYLNHPESTQIWKNDNLKIRRGRDTDNIRYTVNVSENSVRLTSYVILHKMPPIPKKNRGDLSQFNLYKYRFPKA